MKSITRLLQFASFALLMTRPFATHAADAEQPGAEPPKPSVTFADWLGFAKGLQIDPKVISATDDSGTTFGIEYKYNRARRTGLSGNTDLSFSLHSEGLVGVDSKVNYNHFLTHGFSLSVLDIFPREEIEDKEMVEEHKKLAGVINRKYFRPWQKLAEKEAKTDDDRAAMTDLYNSAKTDLEPYGELLVGPNGQQWELRDERGNTKGFINALYDRVVKRRVVYLMADLNAEAETDDRFTDAQLVGSASLRAKLEMPFLDFPFEMLRSGGGRPKSFLNRKGGPYIWGGIGLVDPSNNDTRKAIALEDDTFLRAHVGLFYRTEVLSLDAEKSVALELTWRYYHEFDAPRGIRQEKLDETSYFRVTLLFPKNLFIEYTNGKLPLDVQNAETIMGGWRYNF